MNGTFTIFYLTEREGESGGRGADHDEPAGRRRRVGKA